MSNGNWPLQADDVIGLPLDELALVVLRDAAAQGAWNWRNWLLSAKQNYYPQRPDALQAFAEAWSWLHTHGLISWSFDQPSDAAFKISRRGYQVLKTGLTWLRAAERLDIDLVPALERNARPQFLRGDFETAAFVVSRPTVPGQASIRMFIRKGTGYSGEKAGILTGVQRGSRQDGGGILSSYRPGRARDKGQ